MRHLTSGESGIVHLEKKINAPVARVYGAFQQTKDLKVWYDPRSSIDKFQVGGKLVADNYPSAEILALVPDHTIVHRYSDIVSGTGIWSFIGKNAKATVVILDHLDAYDTKEDRDSIMFYGKDSSKTLQHSASGVSFRSITMLETISKG